MSVDVFAIQVTSRRGAPLGALEEPHHHVLRISRELTLEQNTKLSEIRDKRFAGRGGRGGARQQ